MKILLTLREHKELLMLVILVIGGHSVYQHFDHTAKTTTPGDVYVTDCTEPKVVSITSDAEHSMDAGNFVPEHTDVAFCTQGTVHIEIKARPF